MRVSMQIRCPVCGMQVKLNRIKPRNIVAVEVGSKGDRGIFNKIVAPPRFVLERIKYVLESISKGFFVIREMENLGCVEVYSPQLKEIDTVDFSETEEVM